MDAKTKSNILQLNDEMHKELEDHLIPFWLKLKDVEHGGFYGLIDYDLVLDKNAVKGCILNSRILWFFSRAYRLLKKTELLKAASHAFNYLKDYFIDKQYGGVYWSLNADGSVSDNTKHTYNQAFAIYGLINYFEVSGDKNALSLAWNLYEVIESKCRDENGYLEAFSYDFKPSNNEKLSENGVMATRTMNTLLHVFEAYTDLYRVTNDTRVKEKLHFIMNLFTEKIWNTELKRQEVFFDSDYNSLIDLYSYGHDIETSWLFDYCLNNLHEENYTTLIQPITDIIADRIFEIAYHDNSLLNECERGVNNTKRVWWVQAETVVGFFNAWQKSGEEKYLDAAVSVWEYIKKYMIDNRKDGEWFSEVEENHNPITKAIVDPWKCPYHNGRMCMEIITRTEAIRDKNF